ncbi:pectinesterase family protein [Lacrimispora sp. JR3]|uniref:pectinesterase family protein n=1 Tax=Lacrimispora sinapis TaxID=3111456 RepID=UPI0037496602
MNGRGCRTQKWKRGKVFVEKRGISLLMAATMAFSLVPFPVAVNGATGNGSELSAEVEKDGGGSSTSFNKGGILAFPGAEGGGRFASGGRGQEVYTVTNLKDYGVGETPVLGSLRYGLKSNRTIVFAVAGTIELKQNLSFKGLKNLTLAGQTAPGDGITLSGWSTDISNSENLIIRYLRFRPGAANIYNGADSMDSLWGRDNRTFIIDHCSMSFSTDECLSTYRGEDGTVQWSIVSESLTLSGHSKGRHGYGGIFGGNNVTFHHNLIANHTSRNPRIGGGYGGAADANHVATVQVSNNVLYNWGYYSFYGGGFANTNYINNYLKAGPGTRDRVADRVADAGEVSKVGGFYINGNYMEGNKKVSEDNRLGIQFSGEKEGEHKTTIASVPYSSEGIDSLAVEPAVNVYEKVLKKAGATYPRRDAIDARITYEVRNGKGKYINTEEEIGGYPALEEARAADFDRDQDGMEDGWELKHGLDPTDKEDGRTIGEDGYSNLEHYLNSLVTMEKEAENPTAELSLPENAQFILGQPVEVEVQASSAYGHPIVKAEFFNGAQKIGEDWEAPYSFSISGLEDGSYDISAKVTDSEGNATQTSPSRIHINTPNGAKETGDLGNWSSMDIGHPLVPGSGSLVNGTLTVKGSGKLGREEGSVKGTDSYDAGKDDFHYVYQEVKGDVEITARLNSVTSVDNHAFSGIMIREDLTDGAKTAALGLSWVKYTKTTWSAYLTGRNKTGGAFDYLGESLDSVSAAEKKGISLVCDIPFKSGRKENGYWMKLVRSGDAFTAYGSEDGKEWIKIGTRVIPMKEQVYVGFAADANQVANKLYQLNTARFTNVSVNASSLPDTYALEITDPGNLLKTSAFGSAMLLTQTATKGAMPQSAGDPGSHVSYLGFPETAEAQTMSLDLKIKNYSITGEDATRTGLFVGVFQKPEKGGLYASLGFRGYDSTVGSDSLSGYWIKGTGNAGNGSPKYTVSVGTRYHVVFEKNASGYRAVFTNMADKTTDSKQFKTTEMLLTPEMEVSYGLALIGVSAEIKNLTLKNENGTVLYDQNHTYKEEGIPPIVTGITKTEISGDRSSILLAWTGKGAAGDGRYVLEVSEDGGNTYQLLEETEETSYTFSPAKNGGYRFKIYGICKGERTTAVISEAVEFVLPLTAPTVTAESRNGAIMLNWDPVPEAAAYEIYRSKIKAGAFNFVASTSEHSYTDTVENERPYYYQVIAKSDTNSSNPSSPVFSMATAGHQGTYAYGTEAAVFTVTKKSNDTILSEKNVSLKGTVDRAGTVWLTVNGNTVKSDEIKAGKKFNYRFSIENGSNDVVLYHKDERGRISRKPFHFVGLQSYDMLVDSSYSGTDGQTKSGIPTFKTVQAAVSAVPGNNKKPIVIFIRNGSYYEKVDVTSPYVSLIGEDSEKTVLYFDKASGSKRPDGKDYGTGGSSSVTVASSAAGFTAENMTIANTFDYVNSTINGKQAVAFYNNADQSIISNVRFLGYQDTLCADGASRLGGRQYYRQCYVEGNVDFIFGRAQAVFEDCDIVSLLPGYITAPSTESTRVFGYVFLDCRLYAAEEVGNGKVYLGRPWGATASAVYLNCYMGPQISDAGYTNMGSSKYQNARFAEYGSYGPGFQVTSSRIQLSKEEAEAYTLKNIFAADVETGGFLSAWDAQEARKALSKKYGGL